MTVSALWPSVLFLIVLTALVKPCGIFLQRVLLDDASGIPTRALRAEQRLFRFCGIDSTSEMHWAEYARAFVWFSVAGTLVLYAILRFQRFFAASNASSLATPLTPDLAMNTALSFSTTTTWQAYAGESTMTYGSQLIGLAAQNFLAGAAGLAVGIAFIRALSREESRTIGNFWVDVVRATLWVLLPLSLIGGLVLVWQGVPMNFDAYVTVHTLGGFTQTIASGPVAALEFIKQLGTNGGGFFNANGAHPLENPSPLANQVELLAIAVLPAALTYTYGRVTRRQRDGWVLYGVMVAVFVACIGVGTWSENAGTPTLLRAVSSATMRDDHVANMEGKETRFGIGPSVLAAAVTSGGATGSYNSMHDSYTPVGGAVPFANMLLGEISFGGLGTGLISIVMVAVLGIFVTGLMIGRTPEYHGKTIGPTELKLVTLYMLIAPAAILIPAAVAVLLPVGTAGLTTNQGAHGFTEILYAYTSAFGNNGQNFAGLSANSPFYNITTAAAMMCGRFALIIPALALAGQLASAKRRHHAAGMPTNTLMFGVIVLLAAVVTGALTFFPAFSLGPLAEHFAMLAS